MRYRVLGVGLVGAFIGLSHKADASPPLALHVEAAGAHAAGSPQGREYRLGGEGRVAGELFLSPAIGAQIELGGLWLSRGDPPVDPNIAAHGAGSALLGMVGIRLHPFVGALAGLWADANVGYVRTGTLNRPGFDADLGYDWKVDGGRWAFGPCIGYLQVLQPGDALRPEDAHVLSLGLHIRIGGPHDEPPPPSPATVAPPPPPSLADRDHDGIGDENDACPDVPGVASTDPQANGCPPPGDGIAVVVDHIEYDDVLLFDTNAARVRAASPAVVGKLAKFIVANPGIEEVNIIGHADERGSAEFNLRLSQARADAVKALLVSYGVEPSRLTTTAYGESRPRARGHSERSWRQNRRVEFVVTKVRNPQGGSTSLKPSSAPAEGPTP